MRPSYQAAVLLALAAGAALPPAAVSASPAAAAAPVHAIPITVTSGDQPTTGTFRKIGQFRWYKVALDKGQDYAFWGTSLVDTDYGGVAAAVYDAAGERLLSFLFETLQGPPSGREFRAPSAGTYYLKLTAVPSPEPPFPVTYHVGVAFDCRTGPTTRCVLEVGRKPTGYFNFYKDEDWRRIAAKAGRHYTVLLGSPLASAARVVDRDGAALGGCERFGEPLTPCVGFTAAYSGPYYVDVSEGNTERTTYQVGLTSP